MKTLPKFFFNQDASDLAKQLLGKAIFVKYKELWLSAMITETEAYYLEDRASHASLGFTEKRKALFMAPGTIYMYYARGGDSLNVSARGEGCAVLIKAGVPWQNSTDFNEMIKIMQRLNPIKNTKRKRDINKLCAGQTLLCRSLNLKVKEWDQKQFDHKQFYITDVSYYPKKIIQTTRLGIPQGRDHELHYRFIDFDYADCATSNPLRKRGWEQNKNYFLIEE